SRILRPCSSSEFAPMPIDSLVNTTPSQTSWPPKVLPANRVAFRDSRGQAPGVAPYVPAPMGSPHCPGGRACISPSARPVRGPHPGLRYACCLPPDRLSLLRHPECAPSRRSASHPRPEPPFFFSPHCALRPAPHQ